MNIHRIKRRYHCITIREMTIKYVIVLGVPQVSANGASVQSLNVRSQWRPTEAVKQLKQSATCEREKCSEEVR
jgi:hypothetical protein